MEKFDWSIIDFPSTQGQAPLHSLLRSAAVGIFLTPPKSASSPSVTLKWSALPVSNHTEFSGNVCFLFQRNLKPLYQGFRCNHPVRHIAAITRFSKTLIDSSQIT